MLLHFLPTQSIISLTMKTMLCHLDKRNVVILYLFTFQTWLISSGVYYQPVVQEVHINTERCGNHPTTITTAPPTYQEIRTISLDEQLVDQCTTAAAPPAYDDLGAVPSSFNGINLKLPYLLVVNCI